MNKNWESKPTGLTSGSGFGKMQNRFQICEAALEIIEVSSANLFEMIELFNLRRSNGRLKISSFKVVADFAVDVLMIVTSGKVSKLEIKPASA